MSLLAVLATFPACSATARDLAKQMNTPVGRNTKFLRQSVAKRLVWLRRAGLVRYGQDGVWTLYSYSLFKGQGK